MHYTVVDAIIGIAGAFRFNHMRGNDLKEGGSVSNRFDDPEVPNLNDQHDIVPKHSSAYRVRHLLRSIVACAVIAALTMVTTAAAASWIDISRTIDNNVTQVITSDPTDDDDDDDELIDPNAGKPIQILLLGQDTRDGAGNEAIGGVMAGEHNADTTMIVQISADRTYINLVSIPRDSLVDAPSCKTTNGTVPARTGAMFNSIFAYGWSSGGDLASAASCTLTATNALTGLDIDNFVVADFQGVKNMIDAIGGVDVCVPVRTTDDWTGLDLEPGLHHLDGTSATQYARMRHGTGTDGSDIMRTTRQQYLIKQLLNEALNKNLFTQSNQLYQLSKATLDSLNMSPGLANMNVFAGLAMSLKSIDTSRVYALTTPNKAAPQDHNRVVWTEAANDVWSVLREGKPLTKLGDNPSDSSSSSDSGSSDSTASESPSTPTPDPQTGLITQADGTLLDPNTGGIVDKETGVIRDADTGQYIGMADRYLNATICKVSSQS